MNSKIVLLLVTLSRILYGQDNLSDLRRVESLLQDFEYQAVITTADSIIRHSTRFDTTARIELLRKKGIAEYSLNKPDQAQYTFLEILRLNNNYIMDPFDTPPKITELFNIMKTSYNSRPVREKIIIQRDSVVYSPPEPQARLSTALMRSALLPGWGHHSITKKNKAQWLAIGALLTLTPAVYFSWDSYVKEEKYLNETNHLHIESRYDDFNTSYKLRNFFILSYAALWIYAQWDVLQVHSTQQKLAIEIKPKPSGRTKLLFDLCFRF
jgi:hypothetical protein